MSIVRRSKAGQVFEGKVLNCADPLIVRWPGTYACNADGNINPAVQLEWDRTDKTWKRVR